MKGLLFTYLVTGGGAVAGLANPFYGLLAYICFAIVRPEYLWHWSVSQGNYSRMIAIGMLAGWALRGFGNWRFGRAAPIAWAYVGFWLWGAASSLVVAFDYKAAWSFLDIQLKILLPFLVGITTIDTVAKLKQLAWVMVGSLGYLAFEFNLSYFGGRNRIWPDGFGSMDNNCVAIMMVTGVGMAMFLGMRAERWWLKAAALAGAMLMAHSIMFAFSRGGMLALIIMAVVAFSLVPKQPKHYLAFAAMVLLGIRLAGPQVVARFSSSFDDAGVRDESANSRLVLWGNCWDVMLKNPVFGVGPDHWPLIAPEYGWERGKEAHSLWMQTGAELGFPGLGMLLLFFGMTIVRLWPLAREKAPVADPWLLDAGRMIVSALIGFCVSASFVTADKIEFCYYAVLVGAIALKINSHSAYQFGNLAS